MVPANPPSSMNTTVNPATNSADPATMRPECGRALAADRRAPAPTVPLAAVALCPASPET